MTETDTINEYIRKITTNLNYYLLVLKFNDADTLRVIVIKFLHLSSDNVITFDVTQFIISLNKYFV